MEKEIQNLIQEAFAKAGFIEGDLKIDIKTATREDFGDFSAIISGNLQTEKGKEFEADITSDKNPCQKIADAIADSKIFNIEFKPARFINFFLKNEFLLENLAKVLKEKGSYGQSDFGKGKTVVIDYSAPNIAKPFGIGHLRSTIIGQAIYNIYQSQGYEVIGDNHLGDWGTQFGKLIYQIKTKKLDAKKLTIDELEKIYVEFHQQAKENPKLDDEARAWFKKLEEGDQEAKAIWQACFDISMQEFDRIYKLLGVKIDNALGESFYLDKMQAVFEELKEKGLAQKSEGAWVIMFPNEELPTLPVIKSDGATTYFLRDLATIQYRLKIWQPSLIIYEVGVDQSLHFRQLFKTIEMLGWTASAKASASQGQKIQLVHVAHGLMRSKTGKFSTRKGETIHLEEVLLEAVNRAQEIIASSETDKGLTAPEKEALAQAVGIGAIKYNDLSQHYSRDIIFDWDKILNLKGNSGPYLQYVYARCQSVLAKAKQKLKVAPIDAGNLEDIEKSILRELAQFPEIVAKTADKFSPNLVCNYCFNLAQLFNFFYAKHSILQADTPEQKNFRLALTFAVGQVLKNGLTLLGIESPDKM